MKRPKPAIAALSNISRATVHWVVGFVFLGLVCCAPAAPFIWADEMPAQAAPRPEYRIKPGDQLEVSVWKQTQLSGEYVVRLDGKITLPLVGEIAAGGLTPDGVAAQITRRLDGLVLNPKVSVAVNETTEARISVLGEVRTPGRFAITDKDGVLTALSLAGGLTEFARTDGIYVLRQDYDGKRVRIRFDFRKLAGGQGRGADFLLRNGDIVVIE